MAKMSLNRAHKVVERIRAQVKTESARLSTSQIVSATNLYATSERLEAAMLGNEKAIAEIEKLNKLVFDIRTQLDVFNHQSGVSKLLAMQDCTQKTFNEVKKLTDASNAVQLVSVEKAKQAVDALSATEEKKYVSYQVDLVSAEFKQTLKEKQASLQKELFKLADEISALNASQYEFQVDEQVLAQFV